MAMIDPLQAASLACGRWANRPPASPLTSFAIDTRYMRPGETFIALKGESRDGHAFLESAIRQNALAAVVDTPDESISLPQLVVDDVLQSLQSLAGAWRETFPAPVIAITGSYGKTTVKEMLGSVLGSIWFRSQGNFNNHIGVPLSLLELDPTHHAGAILEAGINSVGEMPLLAGLLQPDMAIITAIGPAHLENLGDLETVAREKAILAHSVAPGGHVFIPASLLQFEAFRNIPESVTVHAIGLDGDSVPEEASAMKNLKFCRYLWATTRNSRGMGELETMTPMHPWKFAFQAGSSGMVSNLALVVHVALHLGVPAFAVQRQLDVWRPFRHRGQTVFDGDRTFYVDCYNANPGSMLDSASRFANLFPDRQSLYVLGSMNELGADSEAWHRQTGLKLEVPMDSEIYLLGHGSEAMAEGFRQAGLEAGQLHIVDGLDSVRERLKTFSGAVFLKGSRTYGLESLLPEEEGSC